MQTPPQRCCGGLQPPPLLDELAAALLEAALLEAALVTAELLAAKLDALDAALELLAAELDALVAKVPDVIPLPVWAGAPPAPPTPPPAPIVSTPSPSSPVAQATRRSPAAKTTKGEAKPMALIQTSGRMIAQFAEQVEQRKQIEIHLKCLRNRMLHPQRKIAPQTPVEPHRDRVELAAEPLASWRP